MSVRNKSSSFSSSLCTRRGHEGHQGDEWRWQVNGTNARKPWTPSEHLWENIDWNSLGEWPWFICWWNEEFDRLTGRSEKGESLQTLLVWSVTRKIIDPLNWHKNQKIFYSWKMSLASDVSCCKFVPERDCTCKTFLYLFILFLYVNQLFTHLI